MMQGIKSPLRGIRSPFGAQAGNGLTVTARTLAFLNAAQPFTVTGGNTISVADTRAAGGTYGVALTISGGTFSLSSITGLSFSVGDGTNDTAMTFTGSLADIIAALASAVINSIPSNTTQTLSITFSHAATSRSVNRVVSVIAGSVVANTVLPAISGNLNYGNLLTGSNGTWTGYPAPTFTYQWQNAGSNISGQTANSFTPAFGDVGDTITFEVTGSNIFNSVMAESAGVVILDPGALTVPAPILDWDDETADTTPDFTATLVDPVEGDTLTLQLYSDSGLTTLIDSAVNTLDAGEVAGLSASFALAALSDGTYYARVLAERTGWSSAYSNTVTVTISSGPTTGRLLEDGTSFRLLEDGTSFRLLEG